MGEDEVSDALRELEVVKVELRAVMREAGVPDEIADCVLVQIGAGPPPDVLLRRAWLVETIAHCWDPERPDEARSRARDVLERLLARQVGA